MVRFACIFLTIADKRDEETQFCDLCGNALNVATVYAVLDYMQFQVVNILVRRISIMRLSNPIGNAPEPQAGSSILIVFSLSEMVL